MKGKISSINARTVNTKNGPKVVYTYLIDGTEYEAWAGKWNERFSTGMEIEVPEERIKRGEYKGKPQLTLQGPPFGSGGGFSNSGIEDLKKQIEELKVRITALEMR